MSARVLSIEARHLQTPGQLASLADFTVSDDEEVDAKVVLDNPSISLYCLEDVTKRAIFVELPPGTNLAASPFVYTTQGELATRLISVPYDAFLRLAQHLPRVGDNLILIYITGRSGSTLLSHAFNQLDNVLSLSEPDVANQFAYLRDSGGRRDTELRELLDATVRFLFKPNELKNASRFALKFRNEVTRVMDLYQATFPQAKNIFLYRSAVGFVASMYRLLRSNFQAEERQPLSEWLPFFESAFHKNEPELRAYLGESSENIPLVKFSTLWWLLPMEHYLLHHKQKIPALAVRYEDLTAHREITLAGIFSYCGLPTSAVETALAAFEEDSQVGTILAREDAKKANALKLNQAQLDDISAVLNNHPTINTPDFIVPGTLQV